MRYLLRKIWDFLSGAEWARKTIEEHQRLFPGRCPICSFHRFGLQEGMIKDAKPKDHFCPERNSLPMPATKEESCNPKAEVSDE